MTFPEVYSMNKIMTKVRLFIACEYFMSKNRKKNIGCSCYIMLFVIKVKTKAIMKKNRNIAQHDFHYSLGFYLYH